MPFTENGKETKISNTKSDFLKSAELLSKSSNGWEKTANMVRWIKNSYNNKTRPNTITPKDKESNYLNHYRKITDEDYIKLFGWLNKMWQWALGDCYLISTINTLARCKYFDTLMKTSLKAWPNGSYTLYMPLGEPWWVHVDVSQDELKLAKVTWNLWYKIIEIWFAKYILKQTKLGSLDYSELARIAGGRPWFALQTLLWARSLEWFTMPLKSKKPQTVINLLKTYNLKQGQWFITLSSFPWKSDQHSYNIRDHTIYYGHAYAVIWVEKDWNWWIKNIKVQNPWNTASRQGWNMIDLSLNEFFTAFSSMDVAMLTDNFLNLTTSSNEITVTDIRWRWKAKS